MMFHNFVAKKITANTMQMFKGVTNCIVLLFYVSCCKTLV